MYFIKELRGEKIIIIVVIFSYYNMLYIVKNLKLNNKSQNQLLFLYYMKQLIIFYQLHIFFEGKS